MDHIMNAYELDTYHKRITPAQVKHIWRKARLETGEICQVIVGIKCPVCGNELLEIKKFCPYCGQAVKDD